MAVVLSGDVHLMQDKTTNIKIRITQNRKVEYNMLELPYEVKGSNVLGNCLAFNYSFE